MLRCYALLLPQCEPWLACWLARIIPLVCPQRVPCRRLAVAEVDEEPGVIAYRDSDKTT